MAPQRDAHRIHVTLSDEAITRMRRLLRTFAMVTVVSALLTVATTVGITDRGAMGTFAVFLEDPVGLWAMSYPVLGMALVIVIGIFAWALPGQLVQVLETPSPMISGRQRDLAADYLEQT